MAGIIVEDVALVVMRRYGMELEIGIGTVAGTVTETGVGVRDGGV